MSDKHIPAELRRLVQQRARGLCEYCRSQQRFSPQSFSVEHIKPRAAGGPTTLDNLALSCQGCNGHKYSKEMARDPITGSLVPLFDPRMQNWREHFAWNDGATLILGFTPTGRATVETLQMNRQELVNLREVLYTAQKHPPTEPNGEEVIF